MSQRTMDMRPQEIGFPSDVQELRDLLKVYLKGKLLNPCPGSVRLGVGIGIDFGYTLMPGKRSRAAGKHRFHKGVDAFDWRKKEDTEENERHNELYGDVLCMYPGRLIFSGALSDDYGGTVIMEHFVSFDEMVSAGILSDRRAVALKGIHGEGLKFFTLVCHCEGLLWDANDGEYSEFDKEDVIAHSGADGNADAVHQHIEVRLLTNESGSVVDPVPLFDPQTLKIKGGGAYWEDKNTVSGVIMREHSADY